MFRDDSRDDAKGTVQLSAVARAFHYCLLFCFVAASGGVSDSGMIRLRQSKQKAAKPEGRDHMARIVNFVETVDSYELATAREAIARRRSKYLILWQYGFCEKDPGRF
jgi:hypothetical protein